MTSQVSPSPSDGRAAYAGKELWLLRAGSRPGLDACLRAFAGTALDVVLAPPGAEEQSWAAALARASGDARLELDAALASDPVASDGDDRHARAWSVLVAALAAHARCLAVLGHEQLLAAVGRALDLDALDPRRMRVDPGRAVLLRGGAHGLELRRANVLGPETDPGMALPGAGAGAR
jgi:hypothetical protein